MHDSQNQLIMIPNNFFPEVYKQYLVLKKSKSLVFNHFIFFVIIY